MSLEIRLKRPDKVYYEGEVISGVVVVTSMGDIAHQGIKLSLEGIVNLQLSAKSVGMFEAFYNSIKPIQLMSYSADVARPGRLPGGRTELPFEIPLKAKSGLQLYETYHGVFVNITYKIRAEMKRSMLSKDLANEVKFKVEYKKSAQKHSTQPVEFTVSPENLENVKQRDRIPKFKLSGKLESAVCSIEQPFVGEITVEESEATIKSIELQLVRVETCGCAEGYAKDATEIQNIQIGDGNVAPKMAIPIYMIFPRLFTCPTLATKSFKVEFEVNVVVVFQDGHLVTENFPIKLVRD